jgi:hypothetical protein
LNLERRFAATVGTARTMEPPARSRKRCGSGQEREINHKALGADICNGVTLKKSECPDFLSLSD